MSTASVLMKPTSVPADGFYVVRIDDREYSACVVNGVTRYAHNHTDSEPIPWEEFDRFEGQWWTGSVRRSFSESEPDFYGPATLQIDLTPFCDPDGTRYSINRPWILRGWEYATDGRIAVRLKTDKPDDVSRQTTGLRRYLRDDETKVPDIEGLGWKHAELNDWQPWPEAAYEDGEVSCEADGCDSDYIEFAEDSKCKSCNGKGYTIGPYYQPIGAIWIGARYDRLIRQLPGVEYSFGDVKSYDLNTAILFRFDGGEGIIMPIDRSKEGK